MLQATDVYQMSKLRSNSEGVYSVFSASPGRLSLSLTVLHLSNQYSSAFVGQRSNGYNVPFGSAEK